MKECEPTLEQFKVMFCQRGLDPGVQDVEQMYAAWCLLHEHMEKMRAVVRSTQGSNGESHARLPQPIFNPTYLIGQEDK